ncbi:hypothetical protein BU17DRAFT_89328 [Hysterangium stoloniferum]|nr:hypothetical protein BU17DRAFT_89328 [Hysterangium stoloniferum]
MWNALPHDMNLFTAISDHLASVAALNKLVEETRESDRKKVKMAVKLRRLLA